MIALLRVGVFFLGLLAVIVGAALTIIGGLGLFGGFAAFGLVQFVPGLILLLLGTVGATKLDRVLQAKRDRQRLFATQTSEFD